MILVPVDHAHETRYARSGDTHIAYQVTGLTRPDALDLRFEDRGDHALKSVPGTWRVLAVAT